MRKYIFYKAYDISYQLFVSFQHRIFSGLYLTDEAPLDHYNNGMKSLSHILLYDVVLGNRSPQTALLIHNVLFNLHTVIFAERKLHCHLHTAVFLFCGGL